MKHSLQLKFSQHLTLTPQLQQSIKLLQLSTIELGQEVERMLQENPLLERDDEPADAAPMVPSSMLNSGTTTTTTTPSSEEGSSEGNQEERAPELAAMDWSDDGFSNYGSGGGDDGEDGDGPQVAAGTPTLRQYLNDQLSLMQLPDRDRRIASYLVDNLDDDGFMKQDLNELASLIPVELEIDLDDLHIALKHLQHLDPVGVGARSLGECLSLQLEAMAPDTPFRASALEVVRNHLETLAARDFQKLKKVLHCDDDELRGVQNLITHLNPRPAGRFSDTETRYIVPDVIVRKVKGLWVAALNPDAMPKLRINRMYADILRRNREASQQQLSGQLQEAKWLIKNVQQRFDTILRVSQAIVDRQRHFFEHGEVAMRPLVLREIAEILDLHESTVSRVTTQKFMHTDRGIFELKYFFGSHVYTDTGGACSATAIRALIKQMVGEEDTRRPLSDSQISETLGKQGINVARRTIAKYRESLQILPVNLRKSL
jgi:RNA polymerase sigma-54 factor